MKNIPLQLPLRPALPEIPTVYGTSDYREFRAILIKIDEVLIKSGIEKKLIDRYLKDHHEKTAVEKQQAFLMQILSYAIRCNIARHLTGESFRKFSIRLADSSLFQWFTGISGLEHSKAGSKSALHRYEQYFDTQMIDEEIKQWLSKYSNVQASENIGLSEPLSFSSVFIDSTCLKANIHFPVDWVLLRDAARSLLLAIKTIRAQGLKHRMIDPDIMMRQMNKLAIEMTHTRRRIDSKKKRKMILRTMKKLSQMIGKHGERYKALLSESWQQTEWTERQAHQVIARIDNVLNQLPLAIKQAHERIIGERKIASNEKLLSLYESDAHIIIRGKAGSEIEFGNGLLLSEQSDGLIIDWELFKDQPKSDSRLLEEAITRIEQCYGSIESISADRGFSSKANQGLLKQHDIYDAVCPKSPEELIERLKEPRFIQLQRRRAQTEARIGVFKNVFLGNPLKSKGFLNKEKNLSWCVLTHNLWVISRKLLSDEKSALEKAA